MADDPFADGLFLTNMAHAFEASTNAGTSSDDAIIQFVLNEPVLVSSKGVVYTNNPNAVFTPVDVGPAGVSFLAPGTPLSTSPLVGDHPFQRIGCQPYRQQSQRGGCRRSGDLRDLDREYRHQQ